MHREAAGEQLTLPLGAVRGEASGDKEDPLTLPSPPPGEGEGEQGLAQPSSAASTPGGSADWLVIVDRLAAGSASDERLRESLETAFNKGAEGAVLLVEESDAAAELGGAAITIDGRTWRRIGRSGRLVCDDCGLAYPQPEPRLFSFNSPLGACPDCEGFGNVVDVDMDLVVPDRRKSIREGAIAPWNTPAYAHEREELLALAADYGLPVDAPFADLTDAQQRLILEGVPERDFGGLRGFFAWLERRKYKMHVRVFLSRWRSYRTCPVCAGARLRPEALSVRVGGKNIAEICALAVDEAERFFAELALSEWEKAVGRTMLEQVRARISFLRASALAT